MDLRQASNCALSFTALTFLAAFPSAAFQNTAAKQPAKQATGPKAGDVKVNPVDKQRYVWIPPGTFESGCSKGDNECIEDEFPTRKITLTKGFWLGETEATQEAWDRLITYNPSLFQTPDRPVEMTTWDDADFFCTSIGGRLPTEAEWEWAARGGTKSARYGNINDIAWYWDNSDFKSHPVKQKKPNAFGLYDMLGNVVEWTHTWYTVQHNQENIDPTGPATAEYKSLRGGGWWDNPALIRVSYRRRFETGDYDYNIGFRCVSP
ncbi:MAG: formylglycine-generating enzyme family protein [Bryobacteraceae bacterium]